MAKLTEQFEECCRLLVENVPDLETILHDIPASPVPARSAPAPVLPSQPPPSFLWLRHRMRLDIDVYSENDVAHR